MRTASATPTETPLDVLLVDAALSPLHPLSTSGCRLPKAASARLEHLDRRTLAEVFAWPRPGDSMWNHWMNTYLAGKRSPTLEVLLSTPTPSG